MICKDIYAAFKHIKHNYNIQACRKFILSHNLIKLFNRDNKNVKIIGFSINEINITSNEHKSVANFICGSYRNAIVFALSFLDRSRERYGNKYIKSFEEDNSIFVLNNLMITKSFWFCVVDETNRFDLCGKTCVYLNNDELRNLEKCCLEISSILRKKIT